MTSELFVKTCPNCNHWHVMYYASSLVGWLRFGIHYSLATRWECVNCGIMFTTFRRGEIFWVTSRKFSWWQRLLGYKQPQVKGVIGE